MPDRVYWFVLCECTFLAGCAADVGLSDVKRRQLCVAPRAGWRENVSI